MSIGYREMVTKTLDELCMSSANPLSELMMCGLDCPWLSPFLAPLCHLAAELFKCRLVRRRWRQLGWGRGNLKNATFLQF